MVATFVLSLADEAECEETSLSVACQNKDYISFSVLYFANDYCLQLVAQLHSRSIKRTPPQYTCGSNPLPNKNATIMISSEFNLGTKDGCKNINGLAIRCFTCLTNEGILRLNAKKCSFI